jgi:hypothetical protein
MMVVAFRKNKVVLRGKGKESNQEKKEWREE